MTKIIIYEELNIKTGNEKIQELKDFYYLGNKIMKNRRNRKNNE